MPELDAISNQTNNSFDIISFSASATGDDVVYTATGLPPGVTLDSDTGEFTGTLLVYAVLSSPYTVTVTATNGEGSDEVTFTWTVLGTLSSAKVVL